MDTSALMMPVELDVRVFEELERLLDGALRDAENADGPRDGFDLVAPRAVVAELESLSQGAGEEATAASVGADLATDRCRIVDHEESYADDALVELADEFDGVVTNDKPLRERLLEAGVPVIHLRGRNKLTITQP